MKRRSGNGIEGAMVCTSLGSLLLLFPGSVRPKGLTAERFGRNFGEITAETFSALLSGFGHSAEREFSAENGYFGRKLPVFAEF